MTSPTDQAPPQDPRAGPCDYSVLRPPTVRVLLQTAKGGMLMGSGRTRKTPTDQMTVPIGVTVWRFRSKGHCVPMKFAKYKFV